MQLSDLESVLSCNSSLPDINKIALVIANKFMTPLNNLSYKVSLSNNKLSYLVANLSTQCVDRDNSTSEIVCQNSAIT